MGVERIFIPIRKVDAENHLVYGVLAAETPDLSGEILDYDASKAAFIAWSEGVSKVTEGKSKGNLRVMHNPKVAGRFTQLECNDDLKQIEVCAKVEADDEWKLVETGCYTGFSIGAKAMWKRKDAKDPTLTRYAVKTMIEGSLVDLPCIPTATFDYIKAGQSELRKFIVSDTKTSESSYVSTVSDFRDTFRTVTPQLAKVGASDRTLAAFKTLSQSAGIRKSMWDVCDFACVLQSVNQIRMNLVAEALWEGDNSPIPEKLRTWVDAGAELIKELLDEESSELTQDAPVMELEMAAEPEVVKMAEEVKEVPVEKAAEVTPEIAAEPVVAAEVAKVVEVPAMDIAKSIDEAIAKRTAMFDEAVTKLNDKLEAQGVETTTALKSLVDSIKTISEALKNTPAAAKGVISVSKLQDAGVAEKEEVANDPRNAFKMALSPENGTRIFPNR